MVSTTEVPLCEVALELRGLGADLIRELLQSLAAGLIVTRLSD